MLKSGNLLLCFSVNFLNVNLVMLNRASQLLSYLSFSDTEISFFYIVLDDILCIHYTEQGNTQYSLSYQQMFVCDDIELIMAHVKAFGSQITLLKVLGVAVI